MNPQDFQELIWQKADELYRDMPWRSQPTFYYVLVSELMLQQTQVSRVMTKFAEFVQTFPTIEMLAQASLADVLTAWQGLGYNRRAKFLHEAAQYVAEYGQPTTVDELVKLPGVGKNTAGAIMNYVYNQPTPYIETNIRTVYFHHFFADHEAVSDAQLLQIVAATIDHEHPREWHWALMDYGAQLKSQGLGRLCVSKHYKKQAPLVGSVREVRGQIIRALSVGEYTEAELIKAITYDDRYQQALDGLLNDALIERKHNKLRLTK